jgi:ligand-binding sensor domain-containing protein
MYKMRTIKLAKQIGKLSLLVSASFTVCDAQNVSQFAPKYAAGTIAGSVENIRSMLQDKNDNYWFGSDGGGVYRYDKKYVTLFTDKDGLCHNQVRSIQEDGAGNIWFETGNGICWYDGRAFNNLRSKVKMNVPNHSSAEWRKERGDLWFPAGTWKGVYRCHGDSVFNYQFPGVEANSRAASLPYDPYDIYCIFEDRSGNIWFGTQSKGVCRFDGKDFTWLQGKGLSGAAIRVIFQDKDGNFWFGNNGYGLFRYDGKTLANVTEEKGLGNPEFVKSFKEKAGTLARVWAINEDRNADLWIGAIDAGAWRYDGKNMVNYTKKDGLTDYGITAIYKDKKGELWFGTAGEMCKFNGKSFVKVSSFFGK